MQTTFATKWWVLAAAMLSLVLLSSGAVFAQVDTGVIAVNACYDQNADGELRPGQPRRLDAPAHEGFFERPQVLEVPGTNRGAQEKLAVRALSR